jgi:hypothetical protein
MPMEAYNPECLVPSVNHGSGSLMIGWQYLGILLVPLNGRITASDYVDLLGNQVHPVVKMLFIRNDAIFQDDGLSINTARKVFSLGLRNMKIHFNTFCSQHNH